MVTVHVLVQHQFAELALELMVGQKMLLQQFLTGEESVALSALVATFAAGH